MNVEPYPMENDRVERILRVERYMEAHYAEDLSLDDLAAVADFSKFHFSRIFAAVTGTTPVSRLTRIRLEKSVDLLKETGRTVLDVALSCGFRSLSSYHEAFRSRFGVTPGAVRKRRNSPEAFGNFPHDGPTATMYARPDNTSFVRRMWDMNIEIKELPAAEIAYARHVGNILEVHDAWTTIAGWAVAHGLFPPAVQYVGIARDNPELTDENSVRFDACVTLPPDFVKDGGDEVRFGTLEGGLYGVYRFFDTTDKLILTYALLFESWLPGSGYEADDGPCLEFCLNDPFDDPERRALVDIHIPIRPVV